MTLPAGTPWSLGQLAQRYDLETSVPEVSVLYLAQARTAGRGALALARDPAEERQALDLGAAALLCGQPGDGPRLVAADPLRAYQSLLEELQPFPGAVVSPEAVLGRGVQVGAGAVVEAGAHLGDGCRIGPCCFVGSDVRMGPECVLEPGAVLLDGSRLGRGVRVGAGAVVASDGYGYVQDQGCHVKIPQVGLVELGDGVQIGAGTCIDRATTSSTRLGAGVQVGSLCQIGHNVQIGEGSRLETQIGLPGSVMIGRNCELGWQSASIGHADIGDGTRFAPRTGSMRKRVPPDSDLAGFPARPRKEAARQQAALHRLPEALAELDRMKKGRDG
ncbi:MAG: UDP-3-O-(3-hydroxymyristoyl)glucosamine N-acyltransferase [Candidatus Eremiobacterota bacterium]